MIFVGIDVAKDKHDCFIMNSDGEVLFNALPYSIIKRVSMSFIKKLNFVQLICPI